MALLLGIASGIGLFMLAAIFADNYEPQSPTAEEWMRMVHDPTWSPEKQKQLDEAAKWKELSDYMNQDLTKTWQDYV